MAEVTITYPDEYRDRIVEALCTRFGYQETVEVDSEDVPNPQTPEQFVGSVLAKWVKSQVRKHETAKATIVAEEAITVEIDSIGVTVSGGTGGP
jgi:hypothetical protein